MKQRDKVAMTEAEVQEMLASHNKVQLATNGHDGFPHLVTMYYVMMNGLITFWTYRSSQKALNLGRDPRISCLVEVGNEYFDLKGVVVQGTTRRIEDPAVILEIGYRITATFTDPAAMQDEAVTDYVGRAARKRFGYAVEPSKVISWDHTKLIG